MTEETRRVNQKALDGKQNQVQVCSVGFKSLAERIENLIRSREAHGQDYDCDPIRRVEHLLGGVKPYSAYLHGTEGRQAIRGEMELAVPLIPFMQAQIL